MHPLSSDAQLSCPNHENVLQTLGKKKKKKKKFKIL